MPVWLRTLLQLAVRLSAPARQHNLYDPMFPDDCRPPNLVYCDDRASLRNFQVTSCHSVVMAVVEAKVIACG